MVITLILVGTDVFFMYYCVILEPFFLLPLVSEDSLMKLIFSPTSLNAKGQFSFLRSFPSLFRFS